MSSLDFSFESEDEEVAGKKRNIGDDVPQIDAETGRFHQTYSRLRRLTRIRRSVGVKERKTEVKVKRAFALADIAQVRVRVRAFCKDASRDIIHF